MTPYKTIEEILMALMVAGAIEANNSKDGKLTVEIMESSRGLKGSKAELLALALSCVGEKKELPKLIPFTVTEATDLAEIGQRGKIIGYNQAITEISERLKGVFG